MACSTDSILSKNLTSSVDKLLQLLDKLELILSILDHDPPKKIQGSLVLPMKTLISDQLLRHADEDVKISVTACLTQITRITAPDAPYDDELMKEFLKLAVSAFEKLSHVSGRSYEKAISILENFSKIKMFLIMLDLECDDLVMEMFQQFLRIIRSNHLSNVIESMENVMTGILDESEDISLDLLRPLLDSVKKENQTISPICWTLGEKVITNCAFKLKPYLMQAVVSSGRTLDMYPQIVTSICQNQPESQEHIQSLVQAVENNLVVPKDAHEVTFRVEESEVGEINRSQVWKAARVNKSGVIDNENVQRVVDQCEKLTEALSEEERQDLGPTNILLVFCLENLIVCFWIWIEVLIDGHLQIWLCKRPLNILYVMIFGNNRIW
ncbi:unnamed protein product [Vicia faba]|uniref:Uncharacterized protein n=1 Tax=Vicia faba TaxID=3906 RepID=A0AAV0ZV84_VICFA|nr:unnamed protein product [Vicia faba]